jgi:hypothetical protein
MNTLAALEMQAVQAAKSQDWQAAIDLNLEILKDNPQDIGALMRLGVAYAQSGKKTLAHDAFSNVLEIDKSNQLAKKHLDKLKNHQSISLFHLPVDEQFIEEPGKTKTVELHRLAGKEQLESLSIGQVCELKSKNRFISVEVNKVYVGSLPEDISARLAKFMATGNQYTCYIQSLSSTSCSVFLKETFRSKTNEYNNSFPSTRSTMASLNDVFLADDNVPMQLEDIPPQIVITDADEEKTLDSFHIEEPMEEAPHADDSDD